MSPLIGGLLSGVNRFQHWFQTTAKVADFEGIQIADLKRNSLHFRQRMISALALIRNEDKVRFKRVQDHIEWIVNCTLDGPGAEYHHEFKSVRTDFEEPETTSDLDFSVAFWASSLVHEATHGYFASRGIDYTLKLRSRIERACVRQENIFLDHLAVNYSELAGRLRREYNEDQWNFAWTATPRQRIRSLFRRMKKS